MSTFHKIIHGDKPVLVDFSAEWCGPCKMMAPVLREVKHRIGDAAVILKVDVDRNPALAASLGVQAVPTLVIYRKGKVTWRQSGVLPASALLEALQSG